MTALTARVDQLVVLLMVENNRLLFLGIKELGKDHPSHDQAGNEADNKKQGNRRAGAILLFVSISRRRRSRYLAG
jgi:hypothetical protein